MPRGFPVFNSLDKNKALRYDKLIKGDSKMKKRTKAWLFIGAALLLAGSVIFGIVMTMFNWDFSKLQTVKYKTNTYNITEDYKSISISIDTADILFVPSETEEHLVVCYEKEKEKHSVSVKNGTLVIEKTDSRKWLDFISFSFTSPKITLYIPKGDYDSLLVKSSTGDIEIPKDFSFQNIDITESTGDVLLRASVKESAKIKTTTGNISFEDATAASIDLSVSTGKITVTNIVCDGSANICVSTGKTYLNNVNCKNLSSDGDTGDIYLTNVIVKDKLSLERDTGDVRFDSSDAGEIFIETDTGDVVGSLLTDKVFFPHSDTGKVKLPKTTEGGKCEISTDTGNINIEIK
jgi:DUF4097 and DUF4098 domain-containing protein YvlB